MSAPTVQIPDTLDELLTPTWLNAALSSHFPGVDITKVTRGPVVERLSTNARFRIECTLPAPPELPLDLCVKGYFSEQGRSIGSVGEPEACFYRDLSEAAGVHTLRSVWADVDPATHHGVAITGDVVAAGGRFLDALSPYSVEQVAFSLGQLARLHGYAWERPELLRADWLVPRSARPWRSGARPRSTGTSRDRTAWASPATCATPSG